MAHMIDDIEVSLDKKSREFMRVLRQHSDNKFDPVSEWIYCKYTPAQEAQGERDGKRCICTTPIMNLHYIRNSISGMVIEIGCECIKRWSLGPKCEGGCARSLGSLEKRKKGDNWLCRSCNAKKKKEEEEKERARLTRENNEAREKWEQEQIKNREQAMKITSAGNQLFRGSGKWYNEPFWKVAKDPLIVAKIMAKVIAHPDYWAFRDYLEMVG
jgi:hypothetical protein